MKFFDLLGAGVKPANSQVFDLRKDISDLDKKADGISQRLDSLEHRLTRVETRLCKLCEALKVNVSSREVRRR